MKYCFYYDESEHSRVINLSTVTGETYYDGFLAAIIGWRSDHETAFEQRYHAFEEKYADRKKKGELKSGTIMTLVSIANAGEELFPTEVVFTKTENRIYADII